MCTQRGQKLFEDAIEIFRKKMDQHFEIFLFFLDRPSHLLLGETMHRENFVLLHKYQLVGLKFSMTVSCKPMNFFATL